MAISRKWDGNWVYRCENVGEDSRYMRFTEEWDRLAAAKPLGRARAGIWGFCPWMKKKDWDGLFMGFRQPTRELCGELGYPITWPPAGLAAAAEALYYSHRNR
jgi:hypothetical protein